jgi:MtN3 and saliva related transmembrane protein
VCRSIALRNGTSLAYVPKMAEIIGWASSIVLLVTIAKQILKQWKEQSSEGVSKWLFIGQSTASFGFTVYSLLVRNWVFVVTNALLLVAGITGFLITLHYRRRSHASGDESSRSPQARSATAGQT